MSDKNNKVDYSDMEFEVKALRDKIIDLEAQNQKMKQIISDNDLEDELDGFNHMSEEEYICVKGIGHLKHLFESGNFTKDDVQQLDLLVKNLRLIRNQDVKKSKGKKIKTQDVAELFSIVKGE